MNDDRLDWFPCEASKLLQALQAMKPHEGYVYWIVCLRIYEVGGPCPDTLDVLARRTGYTKRVVSEALDILFRAGKLVREGAGIMNPYASEVLSESRAKRDRATALGREGATRRWQKSKSKQRNDHSQPNAQAMLLTVTDKKDSEAKASALGGAPELPLDDAPSKTPRYTDSTHELWGDGPIILASLGLRESRARQMIGMWLKQSGDAQQVLGAIQRARDHRVHGPIEWITRALQPRKAHERSDQDRTHQPARHPANGSDAILAGVGRVADRITAKERTAGRGERPVSGAVDASGQPHPHR